MTGVDAVTADPDDRQRRSLVTLPWQVLHNLLTPSEHHAPYGPGRRLGQDATLWERQSVHTAAPSADVTLDRTVLHESRTPDRHQRGRCFRDAVVGTAELGRGTWSEVVGPDRGVMNDVIGVRLPPSGRAFYCWPALLRAVEVRSRTPDQRRPCPPRALLRVPPRQRQRGTLRQRHRQRLQLGSPVKPSPPTSTLSPFLFRSKPIRPAGRRILDCRS